MRIEHLEVSAFGALRDFTSPSQALGDFVVVLGRNEAGKSTLFEFLCSMLYGIYPTSAERHPYAPWDGDELGGALRIRLGDDVVEVNRRLRSSPSGTLVRNGVTKTIRNEDLPFVTHVPSRIFRQVHALGLHELASFAEEGWEAVQDRILGRLGATDLRPAREVADELMAEARALWRPDRRGLPQSRRLDEAIREVARRRPQVRAEEAARREAATRLTEIREVLRSAKSEREADRALLERIRTLLPIRAELARIAHLRGAAGPPARLEGLPVDPAAELERLEESVGEAQEAVRRAREERASTARDAEMMRAEDDAVLAEAEAIERLRALSATTHGQLGRLGAATQELRSIERRLGEEVDRLPWLDDPRPDAVVAMRPTALAEAYGEWIERARAPIGAEPPTPAAAPAAPAAALVVVGVAMLLSGLLAMLGVSPFDAVSPVAVGLPGAIVTALGVWVARAARQTADDHRTRTTAAAESRRVALEAREEARKRVTRLLEPVGLQVGASPDPELLHRVDRARHLMRDRDDLQREVAQLQAEVDSVAEEAARLGRIVGIPAALDAAGTSALLQDRLADLRDREAAARRAAERLPALDQALAEAEDALRIRVARRAELQNRLAAFADDPLRAAREAGTALEAYREAERRQDALRSEHPQLDRRIAELQAAEEQGEAWLDEPDPVGSLSREVEQRSEDIEKWVALEKELEGRARPRPDDATLDELEGELQRLRQERIDVRQAHDRLWILSHLVDRADQEIRDTHQPVILRRAGAHLSDLTAGRYDRLGIAPDRTRTLLVSGPAASGEIEVGPPLSTGTQEQIFVALRLALVDQLDDDNVKLPLVLDEVLVNWDADRRGRGLDLLQATAGHRQIFLFTCHPHLAEEAVARGADLWRLPSPSDVRTLPVGGA